MSTHRYACVELSQCIVYCHSSYCSNSFRKAIEFYENNNSNDDKPKKKINNCRIHIGTRSACNIIHSALYPSWLHVESRTPTASTHSNHVHMTIFEQSPSSVLFVSSYIFYTYIFFHFFHLPFRRVLRILFYLFLYLQHLIYIKMWIVNVSKQVLYVSILRTYACMCVHVVNTYSILLVYILMH